MMHQSTVETLPSRPALRSIAGMERRTESRSAKDPFATMGVSVAFSRDEEIYGQHESAALLYKVVSGAVRTYKILSDGRRQIGAFYLPGDVFGFESDAVHGFSAEAVNDTTLRVVRQSALTSLAEREIEVARELWKLTAAELRRVQNHSLLLVQTAHERVASFLLEMASRGRPGQEIQLPMPRRDIADYLGLTIETVSRTLTRLESSDAIELPSSRCIVLRDRAALRRLNG
jgi:CRP/FNR family nitrogen fixation transcriptional regulator